MRAEEAKVSMDCSDKPTTSHPLELHSMKPADVSPLGGSNADLGRAGLFLQREISCWPSCRFSVGLIML
jgi:hypothetical protein